MKHLSNAVWIVHAMLCWSTITLAQTPPTITEYQLPEGGGADGTGAGSIVAGPDGALWFTETDANKIGRMTTSGVLTEYPVPYSQGSPNCIVAGPDGALWFTDNAGARIWRITTSGVFSYYSMPAVTGYETSTSMVVGPDGAFWVTDVNGNKIWRMTTAGVFSQYPVPTAGSNPIGIAVGSDGALWFTEYNGTKIGRITTAGTITEYPLPNGPNYPTLITAGPDGALWFTSGAGANIGRITTVGVVTKFPASAGAGITVGSDGALWFADNYNGRIGRMTTAGTVSYFALSSGPSGIAAGPDGALWFIEYGVGKIGRAFPGGDQTPMISKGGVVSASAFGAFSSITSGTWIEIYGSNLAYYSRSWTGADFNGINAPTSLDGTSVTISGQPAFIDYISPGQVNALVPSNVATGSQQVIVITSAGSSAPYPISVNPTQPGLLAPASFSIGGTQYVVALFTDGATYVLPTGAIPGLTSRPAKPGDTIVLYGIGFGSVVPAVPAGQLVQQSNTLASAFQASVGGIPALASYAGLAPGYTGLYQFNVTVPNVAAGNAVPLTFTLGSVNGAQTLYLAVGN